MTDDITANREAAKRLWFGVAAENLTEDQKAEIWTLALELLTGDHD